MDYINPHVRKILNVKDNKSKLFNNYPSCRYNTQNFILAFIFSFLPPNKVNSIVIYSFFYNFCFFFLDFLVCFLFRYFEGCDWEYPQW